MNKLIREIWATPNHLRSPKLLKWTSANIQRTLKSLLCELRNHEGTRTLTLRPLSLLPRASKHFR